MDIHKLGPYELNSIITGDACELAKGIPDESIDLIFTDPVYQRIDDYRWLAEMAARTLKQGGSVIAFCAHHLTIPCGAQMLPYLDAAPVLEHYLSSRTIGRLFSHSVQCNVMPALWFTKGSPTNKWMALQQADYLTGKRGHKWGKAELMILYRLVKFTEVGDIVLDPFVGGGTTPAVCKMLNRRWLAFEIEPDVADQARQRVANTQPPLPGLVIKQEGFDNLSKVW